MGEFQSSLQGHESAKQRRDWAQRCLNNAKTEQSKEFWKAKLAEYQTDLDGFDVKMVVSNTPWRGRR